MTANNRRLFWSSFAMSVITGVSFGVWQKNPAAGLFMTGCCLIAFGIFWPVP